MELKILTMMVNTANHSLGSNEIDAIIGTTGKSIDSIHKSRTLVIRSINTKYQRLTHLSEMLIKHSRMEKDKRMFRYILNIDNYQAIKDKIFEE